MEALRKYHNAIKSRCLEEAIRRTPDNEPSLLDLACGPGSDQLKWRKFGIKDVLALDSSEDAIIEARKRCVNIGGELYRFVIADCLNRLERYARQSRWSIITSNFALHYMMGDTLRFPLFMDAVTAALRPGGVFTGTLLNGDRLEALMGDSNEYDNGLMVAKRRGGRHGRGGASRYLLFPKGREQRDPGPARGPHHPRPREGAQPGPLDPLHRVPGCSSRI